ncbi:hypothetical protein LJY25_03715 [Hymenobacter sp. BT175]|uniref:hypothetical protein n=1 Tax=Hymenobacter translucens TaxID=2886507 RepID=UPI001D0E74B0|nr:hypothetical protein [Hymenobacter translucens]MCC2545539.1 hypothetical protein [Hymenobacter translucens]
MSKYERGRTDIQPTEVEAVTFTSKKLGAYRRQSGGGYTIFLEKEEGGQATVQVMLSINGLTPPYDLSRSQVVFMPGRRGSQVAYNQLAGYTSSVTNLVVGEVGKKITGTFRYNSVKANPVDQTDVYSIEGTFECYRLPDSE